MEPVTPEKANYIIKHYMGLLTEPEIIALKHYRHSLKIREMPDSEMRTKIYLRNQWITDEPEILAQLDEGYVKFILNCAERVLKEQPNEVFFNWCTKCVNWPGRRWQSSAGFVERIGIRELDTCRRFGRIN